MGARAKNTTKISPFRLHAASFVPRIVLQDADALNPDGAAECIRLHRDSFMHRNCNVQRNGK